MNLSRLIYMYERTRSFGCICKYLVGLTWALYMHKDALELRCMRQMLGCNLSQVFDILFPELVEFLSRSGHTSEVGQEEANAERFKRNV